MKKAHIAILAVFLGLLRCASPAAAAGNQGILEVRVKDHREAIGDFSKLIVTFDEILISPKPGIKFWRSGWKTLKPALASIDLTRYTGAQSATLFRSAIDAGSYDAIHLKIKAIEATLKKTAASARLKNSVGPIKLAFTTTSTGETAIVVDLVVLDLSDHPPQTYEIAVGGYELYRDGKLTDKIPPG
jgi:hypothetical protein